MVRIATARAEAAHGNTEGSTDVLPEHVAEALEKLINGTMLTYAGVSRAVGPGDHCSPHHSTHLVPSSIDLEPSLRVTRHAEGPHVIGRQKDLLKFGWLDFLDVSRQF
jgi:hypothetical protein